MKENDGRVRIIICEILSSSVGGKERTRRLVSMDEEEKRMKTKLCREGKAGCI